jgi:hypothetical protein
MLRIVLISSFAAVLAAGHVHSANAFESATKTKTAWAQAQRACADVGIDPGSAPFDQCVVDLFYSVWDEEYETER